MGKKKTTGSSLDCRIGKVSEFDVSPYFDKGIFQELKNKRLLWAGHPCSMGISVQNVEDAIQPQLSGINPPAY